MNKQPKNLERECVWWEVGAMSLLVFLAVYAIVSHALDLSHTKEIIMSIGASCGVIWSIWVIRTFRNIMAWWANIKYNVDTACELLNETKQEIKEIKFINQIK